MEVSIWSIGFGIIGKSVLITLANTAKAVLTRCLGARAYPFTTYSLGCDKL